MIGRRWMITGVCASTALLLVVGGCGIRPTGPKSISMNGVKPNSNTIQNVSAGSEHNVVGGTQDSTAIALQLKTLAQLGKVDNSPFTAGKSNIAQVKQRWGQPDTQNATGEGTYATFTAKQTAFGFNQSGTIFDVRSYSKQVQSLSAYDVRTALGSPKSTLKLAANQTNEIYHVNETYQLEFIINTESNTVDHVSVFDASAVHLPSTSPTSVSPSAVAIRGIIEGFYGAPWSDQERVDMFKFMQRESLNTYVYAPKGDPYQRVDWRLPYPTAELAQMRTLVAAAKQDDVQFVYSISPGMTGTGATAVNDSITYSSLSDRRALEAKIDQLRSIGVNTFMLSYDDIETTLKPADKAVYGTNYAEAQMELTNQILSDQRAKDPSFQLWFTPTSYYGLIDGPYWQTLRSTLNPNIKVIWTGKWVLNDTITSSQAQTITRLLGRRPIIWDNYPVNDYTYNPGKQHLLMMGPLQGRDATLLDNVSGYVSNPMVQPDASKLALETIADYLKNPTGYQPEAAWNESLHRMPGVTNPTLFRTFAEFNTVSTVDRNGYAPTASMISAFWNAASSSQKQLSRNRLEAEFRTLAALPTTLPPTITDKELLLEIGPWLTKLGEEGRGGLDALQVIDQPSQTNKQLLANQIKLVNSSPYGIGNDIISFMQKVENQG